MKKFTLAILTLTISTFSFAAENNESNKSDVFQKHLKEQMEKEKQYAKEQKFYQGNEYDLKSKEVDKKTLSNVPVIEPDYDFDITDVYRDDI